MLRSAIGIYWSSYVFGLGEQCQDHGSGYESTERSVDPTAMHQAEVNVS
jgi:hypothetical protein